MQIAGRLLTVTATLLRGAVLAAWVGCRTVVSRRRGRSTAELLSTAVDTLARLGPTYIKLAQLLTTRVDILPPEVCRGLARVYDRLPAAPGAQYGELPAELTKRLVAGAAGLRLIGAGSIACVYRADLDDGRQVAVKIRRPGVERQMAADLAILRWCAGWVQRLPTFRAVPVVAMMDQLADCLEQQLDLELEAESLLSLRRNLATMDGVVVPSPLLDLSGASALVMDYIPELRPRERAVVDGSYSIAAVRALRAVYQMLFLDGFVHCDLHPGNLYPRTDGSVVLLDAGFSCRISHDARRAFASFFYRMSRGDGSACADLVIDSAQPIGPLADPDGLRCSIRRLVDRNTRAAVSDFDLVGFTVELFDAQRSHGFLADPEFVIPILSLIVLEGTLRELCPEVDFQLEALPFVLRGLLV